MASTDERSIDERSIDPNDLAAVGVNWDLAPLLDGAADVDALLDAADAIADELVDIGRGRIAEMSGSELGSFYHRYATLLELSGRAGSYAGLVFAADTAKPENGALMAHVQERSTAMSTKLIFIDLEWAAATDEQVDAVLADPSKDLDFVRHHLRSERRYKDHVLSEPEERVLTEKSVTGASAWGRLFDELSSAMEVELPQPDGTTSTVPLMHGLALLQHPDRAVRQQTHEAVTAGLQPGLRTRAFIFNTLLNDKSVDDRLRTYPSWISSRNLANEASDDSVQALVDSVVARYDIPQRWYSLKAKILGLDRLADYDRMASVATAESQVPWSVATETVTDAYSSFSGELAGIVQRFLREEWIDAPATPGKRGGAFCAYTVPSHHPYVLLNWTGKTRDVATLAHELGHGVHGYLSREQGVFQMSTPLTLAETASVFGETVTSKRLLSTLTDPNERLALLASTLEDSIATVFRQIAMNRFEHSVHTARRNEGELAVERFNELWAESQAAMLGDSVEITEGYRSWWSYIPHFMHTPGYVYAYAYGQLLALSVYKRYEEVGEEFVPRYLDLLRAGGSMSPEELGRIVDCDLADPAFWDGGLAIVDEQLTAAEEAAAAAGRG
ncbi:MAG: oligoendopeptidase pepF/M3 family [Ilumatobacteraceae bacterium]|nr:oligoendopeptidase pepF/M3 family [Ilumatobacteraceae bacterium]